MRMLRMRIFSAGVVQRAPALCARVPSWTAALFALWLFLPPVISLLLSCGEVG